MIGAGNIANTHIASYKKNKNAEIVAICDINEKRLNKTADLFNIEKRFTSLDEALKNVEADAADVCVWNCNHAKCTIDALNAGLHVMCEKPMAHSTAEAEEMKKVADANGKLLMIGFVLRYFNESQVAKEFIDSGDMGEIYYSKATYLRRHGAPGGWFCDKERSGGGPVIDLGVHVIDHTRYLMGSPKPVSVYAATFEKLGNRKNLKTAAAWIPEDAKEDDKCDVEDLATALIRYDNGAVTLLETSYSINGEGTTTKELFGTKGGIKVTDGDLKMYMEMNDYMVDVKPVLTCLKDSASGFDREINHFVDCCLNGTECQSTAEDGIVIMKILDAIYESAGTGHEVIIE